MVNFPANKPAIELNKSDEELTIIIGGFKSLKIEQLQWLIFNLFLTIQVSIFFQIQYWSVFLNKNHFYAKFI